MNPSSTRREFLERLGIATAGVILGGYSATAASYPKNETIQIGLIGCGVRVNRRLVPALREIPGTRITAVCDVFDAHLEEARTLAAPGVFATSDYHELLARGDVDAVIIGSPDHWHVPMTIDACKAAKDVYVEKPLTHSIAEGQAVIDAQNRYRRVVQVGTQQRSMPQFLKARELVQQGKLGAVHKIRMTWNRNTVPFQKRSEGIKLEQVDWKRFLGSARKQPFDAYRFTNWRWFWDFGGGILTDLMVHWMDAVYFMQEMGLPAEISTFGDNFVTQGVWETPDTVQTLMRFPKHGAQACFEGGIVNAFDPPGITLLGEDATLFVDRIRLEVTPEARRKVGKIETVYDAGVDGKYVGTLFGEKLHLGNWLEAVRARRQPSAPAEAGVLSAEVAHLCNQAFREGKVIRPKG
jgi:predicted dehydrogenase